MNNQYGKRWELNKLYAPHPVERYWGRMLTLLSCPAGVLKRIEMRAGTQSSLEYHTEKREAYYVVSGTLRVGIRDGRAVNREIMLRAGDGFYIPPGMMHMRIAETDVEILEIATSDDIADTHIAEDGQTYKHKVTG